MRWPVAQSWGSSMLPGVDRQTDGAMPDEWLGGWLGGGCCGGALQGGSWPCHAAGHSPHGCSAPVARASSTPGQTHGPRQTHSPGETHTVQTGMGRLSPTSQFMRTTSAQYCPVQPSTDQHGPDLAQNIPVKHSMDQQSPTQPSSSPAYFQPCTAQHGPVQPISSAVQPIFSPAHFQPSTAPFQPSFKAGMHRIRSQPSSHHCPPAGASQPQCLHRVPGGSSTVPDSWLQPQEAAQRIPAGAALPGTKAGGLQEGWRGC